MGKKVKTGKARKDKYYHLAKETGLRSRAAFKLLQLNRKFEFLEKSRVCIDLCAAPGGWLQVCQQNMPMSSLIMGVDLVSIKPIPNVVTFQEDITTDKCRQTLRKEIHTWKADVVLHDGAPNVGMNWIHDAFQQAQLTLQALKLATEFLKKGGWFVTKVFRSKDYNALLWVFKQLFKSVHATKPQASRNESAEIFVVCQHYKAPDKLDPKFLDVKYVFKDVDVDPKQMINVIHPEKRKKKVEGYDETDTSFHRKVKVSDFLKADNHIDLLAEAHQIVFDAEEVASHPLTTQELKECCQDIKVLGKKEIRYILTWRKNIKKEMESGQKVEESTTEQEIASDDESEEEKMLDHKIADIKDEQEQDMKRKRKRVMKEKRKLRDKMELKMIHPGDHIEETDDVCLFNLKKIKKKKGLEEVQQEEMHQGSSDDDDPEMIPDQRRKFLMAYDRHKEEAGTESAQDTTHGSDPDSDSESNQSQSDDSELDDEDEDEASHNPLVIELESKDARVNKKTAMWFNKDTFATLGEEADEDVELETMAENYKQKGGTVLGKKPSTELEKKSKRKNSRDSANGSQDNSDMDTNDVDSDTDSDSENSDSDLSDYDVHASIQKTLIGKSRGDKSDAGNLRNKASKDGFEIVAADSEPNRKVLKLEPVELALGEEMIKSSKKRRELEEMSFNRFTHGDEDMPDWFAKDEARHCRKQLPVTKDQINAYKERSKSIDARPIKKIAEAKARKKRKMTKKLERARKKADSVGESAEMSEGEKWKQIKEIYKKAGLLSKKKKEVTYVVAKKGSGKKPIRPAGVKGFYKVVDKRQKKDNRGIVTGKNKKQNTDKKSARGMKRKTKGKSGARKS